MSAEDMRRLADAATTSLIARLEGLRDEAPWRGATRAELEALLREPAPEQGQDRGRRARARRARRASRRRTRRPSALLRLRALGPDLAGRDRRLSRRRVQYLPGDMARLRRSQPARAGRHRLVPSMDRLPRNGRRPFHLRRVGCNPRRAGRRPRAGGRPGTAGNLPERPDAFGGRAGSPDHRRTEGRDRRHPIR